MEKQNYAVARSASFHFQQIAHLQPFLDREHLITASHVLVISRTNYRNAVYVGLPLKVILKLLNVQNAAAR